METLSCHSNQSEYATAIKKNNLFVKANAMNIFAKFQLYPHIVSGELMFEHFLANVAFWLPWQQIKLRGLDKICLVEDHLTKKF